MKIFMRPQHWETLPKRITKFAQTAVKCLALMVFPGVFASSMTASWYFIFYRHGWNYDDGMKDTITTAVLPAIGIMYGIMLATIAFATVWGEYKSMRIASKREDLDTFMDLRDEELSPLVHIIIGSLAMGMLYWFFTLKYPSVWGGAMVIFQVSFFLSLMFVVIIEMDDPCSGFWFIRSLRPEWLKLDPKTYRLERCERIWLEIQKKNAELSHK